ncbi:unnamed protein product, partial [Strongylus vulgaris]
MSVTPASDTRYLTLLEEMPLEVSALLDRDSAIYLTGEVIIVKNFRFAGYLTLLEEMPLEVSALLDRDSAIYLTGEVIIVKVTLKNLAPKGRESLAWGSVQLTC